MDTQEKFGLKKTNAILLFIQMLILILSTVISSFVFGFILAKGYGGLMLASSATMLIAHVAIIVHGAVGYNKNKAYYYTALGLFAFAVVINVMVNFRTPFQLGLLTMIFGCLIAFIVRQDNKKLAMYFILTAALFSLVFSIYSAVIADPHSLGDENIGTLTIIAMYTSLFAPTFLSGAFALIHIVRMDEKKE